MTDINLYEILGLQPNCTTDDIKRRYRELVIKHHPDKGGDKDHFELINETYSILVDEEKRADYDRLYRLKKQESLNEFMRMKLEHEEYLKQIELSNTPEAIKTAKEEFKKLSDQRDFEMNYDRNVERIKLNEKTFADKLNDLSMAREQDDIEIEQPNIFVGRKFDQNEFNRYFEKTSNKEIIKFNKLGAYDGFGNVHFDDEELTDTCMHDTGKSVNSSTLEDDFLIGGIDSSKKDEILTDDVIDDLLTQREKEDEEIRKMFPKKE